MDSRDPTSAEPVPSLLRRWLREPLLHVLMTGATLFVVYYALNPRAGQRQDSNRIAITADDLAQIRLAWMAQWQRPPTPEEMRNLLDGKIREEVLSREAMALGLDQDDTIVKRRLAQKMEFVMENASALREPADDELRRWFAQNARRFATPSLVTFRHLYFSPDLRGARARDDAMEALRKLADKPEESRNWQDCPIPSCSRISTPSGRAIRSPISLGPPSRRRCLGLSKESGRAPSSPGWAGIWSGLNRQCPAGFRASKKRRQRSNPNGATSNVPKRSARCSIT
jgi:hypothetical protein